MTKPWNINKIDAQQAVKSIAQAVANAASEIGDGPAADLYDRICDATREFISKDPNVVADVAFHLEAALRHALNAGK